MRLDYVLVVLLLTGRLLGREEAAAAEQAVEVFLREQMREQIVEIAFTDQIAQVAADRAR